MPCHTYEWEHFSNPNIHLQRMTLDAKLIESWCSKRHRIVNVLNIVMYITWCMWHETPSAAMLVLLRRLKPGPKLSNPSKSFIPDPPTRAESTPLIAEHEKRNPCLRQPKKPTVVMLTLVFISASQWSFQLAWNSLLLSNPTLDAYYLRVEQYVCGKKTL
jgi:hypothetical protein